MQIIRTLGKTYKIDYQRASKQKASVFRLDELLNTTWRVGTA